MKQAAAQGMNLQFHFESMCQSMQEDLDTGGLVWTTVEGHVIKLSDFSDQQIIDLIVEMQASQYSEHPMVIYWVEILQVELSLGK